MKSRVPRANDEAKAETEEETGYPSSALNGAPERPLLQLEDASISMRSTVYAAQDLLPESAHPQLYHPLVTGLSSSFQDFLY